jgi:putative MATE family efflux protein
MIKTLKDKTFLKKFFAISFPVMIQMLVSFFVSFIDNVMVGGISDDVVGAVFSVNQISFFFFVITYGLLSGASIYVQQFSGAKDPKHLQQSVRYKIWIGILFLLIFIPLILFSGESIIRFYTRSSTNQEIIVAEAILYLPIIVASYIPLMFANIYGSTFREIGKTKLPVVISVMSLFINAILNYVFIYIVRNGIIGVGIATLIARLVEMTVLIFISHRNKETFTVGLYKEISVEGKLIKAINKKTVVMLVNETLWAGGIIMQQLALASRVNVLSTLSIVATTTEIFGIIWAGLAVGVGVMLGTTLGEGKIEEAKVLSKKLIWMGIMISLGLGFIMVWLAPVIPQLWSSVDTNQQNMATSILTIYMFLLPFFSIANVTYHTLRSGGKTTQALLLDGTVMWLLTVPLAWILATFTSIPLVLLWATVQSIDLAKASFGLYLVGRYDWAKNLTNPFEKKSPAITLSN